MGEYTFARTVDPNFSKRAHSNVWAVVLNLVVGAWVAISPWAIGLLQDRAMASSLIISGIAAVVLGLWELRSDPELHRQWHGTGTAG